MLIAQAVELSPGWVATGIVSFLTSGLAIIVKWQLETLTKKDAALTKLVEEKDKQHRDLITHFSALMSEERNQDRIARHEVSGAFQKALAETVKEHRAEADKDREAFLSRSQTTALAITSQTSEIKLALKDQTERIEKAVRESCQFKGVCNGTVPRSV